MIYPASIYCDFPPFTGWSVILEGHNLTPDQIQQQVTEHEGASTVVTVTEEHSFRYMPRVKWCGNHGAMGCDQEGEWHGHWVGVKSGPGTQFTIAGYEYEKEGSR